MDRVSPLQPHGRGVHPFFLPFRGGRLRPPDDIGEGSPYVPQGFKELPPASITAAAGNAAQCERIALYYKDAGRIREFIFDNRGQSCEFYEAYCRAFLKLGSPREALTLLDMTPAPGPGDDELRKALKKALAAQDSQ